MIVSQTKCFENCQLYIDTHTQPLYVLGPTVNAKPQFVLNSSHRDKTNSMHLN